MKRWQNLAPPDDPNSYYDVDGVWPTNRGTYETADIHAGTNLTAASAGAVAYSYAGAATDSGELAPEYIIDASRIWQYQPSVVGTPLVDRTGGVTLSGRPQMTMYGDICICVFGSPLGALPGVDTVFANTSSNFAALAGAPQGACVAVAANAVGIFNTDDAQDGYTISDVGDYTNWTTGEAVTNRLIATPGSIRSVVSFRNNFYAFKLNSIYRLWYVGGVVKWATEVVYDGLGTGAFNRACAGATGILFSGLSRSDTGTPTVYYYWFDGVNPPVCVNPETEIPSGPIIYNGIRNTFSVWSSGAVYWFAPETGMWGRSSAPLGAAAPTTVPVEGDWSGFRESSQTNACWAQDTSDRLKRFSGAASTGSVYVETTKVGLTDRKHKFTRLTPRLRRRADLGTDSATLTVNYFRELHDTTASSTKSSIAESPYRKRFDFMDSDNYARFKVTFTDLDVEVEDLIPSAVEAGKD